MKAASAILLGFVILGVSLTFLHGPEDAGYSYSPPDILLSSERDPGDVNDSRWQPITQFSQEELAEPFWVRTYVTLDDPVLTALWVFANRSYEVYWNGELLGRNGSVAPDGSEASAGALDAFFTLSPDQATQTTHILVGRIASPPAQRWDHSSLSMSFGFHSGRTYPFLLNGTALPAVIVTVLALISGFIYLSQQFGSMGQKGWLFLAICLSLSLLGSVESWRFLTAFPFTLQALRLGAIELLLISTTLLILIYYLDYFRFNHVWGIAVTAALSSVIFSVLTPQQHDFFYIVFGFAFLVSMALIGIVAAFQQKQNARVFSAIVLGNLFVTGLHPAGFDEWGLMLALLTLVSVTLISLLRHQREAMLTLVDTEHQLVRLRHEFLKRYIQPHFLANTLGAIAEWIARDPREAEIAVEQTSSELLLLGRLVDQSRISVREEIELCRLHCSVMSFRLGTRFDLVFSGDGEVDIPPCILHTVLENAFTHNRYNSPHVEFQIESKTGPNHLLLTVSAPVGDRVAMKSLQTQTGHKYILARLESVFGDNFEFTSRLEASSWLTHFRLPLLGKYKS